MGAHENAGKPDLLDGAFAAANMAYTISNGGKPDAGWSRVEYPPTSEKGKNLATAEAYELVGPGGQHFVAFTGTNRLGDLAPDAGNFLGIKSEKYLAAAALGEEYKNSGVVMTGHSLGGGLAKTAAAVASHGTPGHPAEQTVSVGFDPAPIGSRVLAQHGVDPKHLESQTVQVINKQDPLNRYTWGGQTTVGGGVRTDRENANEVVVLADGAGSPWGISGHRLTSLADPSDPSKLTTKLEMNGSPIDKAAFDRYATAQQAVANPAAVNQILETAKAPERAVVRGANER